MNQLLTIADTVVDATLVVVAVVIAVQVARGSLGFYRFVVAPVTAKRHYPLCLWAWLRWRYLTRSLGLAPANANDKVKSRAAFGFSIGKQVRIEKPKARLRYPRARFRADAYGIIVRVRTVPKVGRKELENAARFLADYWHCTRVQVSQIKPGVIVLRGLRRDPLAEGLTLGDVRRREGELALFLGRDEWAKDRWLPLSGIAGITVGGLPGFGKTSLILSWLIMLFNLPNVQFVILDGKGGGDYDAIKSRISIMAGSELFEALRVFRRLKEELEFRQATVVSRLGQANGWKTGPQIDFPLLVIICDECHTFFDLDGVKADTSKYNIDGEPDPKGMQRKDAVLEIRSIAADLVRKGRSVMILSWWLTQKQTSDAIPTAIRDNCTVGLSFAVKTIDAAVAALGEEIRQCPDQSPTKLRDPQYIGVCVASLAGDTDPYVRVRCPLGDEGEAAVTAEQTAHYCRDLDLAA